MGSQRECTWILGLPGFRVVDVLREGAAVDGALRIQVERRGIRRYACSGCGRRTSRVRDMKARTWHDLPWAAHPVVLVYRQRRVRCRRCGIRTERIEFADPKTRVTRRLQQLIGVDCQSMPTSHAAVRHGVSWGAARRAEVAFLRRWDQQRPTRRPRHIGLDEIQRGKGQRFWTVLSDIVHGEVIGLRQDRSEASATALLRDELTPPQRGRIHAACTDMHQPYLKAVAAVLPVRSIVADGLSVYQVDPDRLNQLAPTVIVTQTQCEVCAVSLKDVEQAVCQLVSSRPRIVSLEPMSLGDVWEDIRRVAAALDQPNRGHRLVGKLTGRLEAIRRHTLWRLWGGQLVIGIVAVAYLLAAACLTLPRALRRDFAEDPRHLSSGTPRENNRGR